MARSIAVLDESTCPRCKMLHGTSIGIPPHGACTSPLGCRCTHESDPVDLESLDLSTFEEVFGAIATESLRD